MAFTQDGAHLVAGYEDGRVLVWTVGEAGEAARWDGHKDGVYALAVIPGGKLVATGGDDGSIALWSWPEGWRIGTLEGHQEAVLALAATPDGKLLASGSGDAEIGLWPLPEGELLGQMKRGKFKSLKSGILGVTPGAGNATAIGVLALAFSPDGARLYSSGLEIKRVPGEPARGAVRV